MNMVQTIQATSKLKLYNPRPLWKTQECHLYRSITNILISPVSVCLSTWMDSPGLGYMKHFSCRTILSLVCLMTCLLAETNLTTSFPEYPIGSGITWD